MKFSSLYIFLFFFSVHTFGQEIPNSKKVKIENLLEITGSSKLGIQVLENMISMYKENYTQIEQKFWDEFRKQVNPEGLEELVIPIYDKNFTEEEIDEIILFYQSPIGKKMIERLPFITQEAMKAGQNWGKELNEKIILQLKSEGYLTN